MRENRLMKPTLLTAAGNLENQDRGLFLRDGRRMALCVADCDDLPGASTRFGSRTMIELVRHSSASLPDDVTVIIWDLSMDNADAGVTGL